jgi:hypothetical protein
MISTVVLPMSLIAGCYGMNFKKMPELEWPWGYPMALGLMALTGISALAWATGSYLSSRIPLPRDAFVAVDHEWRSLKWLIDIHEIVSATPIDWQKVAEKAEQFELSLPIRQTLAVSSVLLGTPLPSYYSPAELPEGVKLYPYDPPSEEAENALTFRHLRLLHRPWDKVRYFSSILFAPKCTDLEFLRLPPLLGFLYYLIRPVRLAGKWGWWILRAAFER